MPVIDIDYAQSSSPFIDYTTPSHLDENVSTSREFEVCFAVTISTSSLRDENFYIYSTDVNDRIYFNPITLSDYSPLNKVLKLNLSAPLNTSTEYTFVIDGIFNAAGEEQPVPHVITFITSDIPSGIPVPENTIDYLQAEDNTLVNSDIVTSSTVEQPVDELDVYVISSTPTNLSYNISGSIISNQIKINFSEIITTGTVDEYKDMVSFERKLISSFETAWEPFPNEWHVYTDNKTLTIANIIDSVVQTLVLDDGYEYRVKVSNELPFDGDVATVYLSKEYTLAFISILTNMYTSVNSVLVYYPSFEPYDVAKEIYLNSAYVSLMNAQATSTNLHAVNYVKYATLYNLGAASGGQSSGNRIVLGDLEVENTTGADNSLLARWLELMEQAEAGLRRKGPLWAVKGENYPSSHQTTRNWD